MYLQFIIIGIEYLHKKRMSMSFRMYQNYSDLDLDVNVLLIHWETYKNKWICVIWFKRIKHLLKLQRQTKENYYYSARHWEWSVKSYNARRFQPLPAAAMERIDKKKWKNRSGLRQISERVLILTIINFKITNL